MRMLVKLLALVILGLAAQICLEFAAYFETVSTPGTLTAQQIQRAEAAMPPVRYLYFLWSGEACMDSRIIESKKEIAFAARSKAVNPDRSTGEVTAADATTEGLSFSGWSFAACENLAE